MRLAFLFPLALLACASPTGDDNSMTNTESLSEAAPMLTGGTFTHVPGSGTGWSLTYKFKTDGTYVETGGCKHHDTGLGCDGTYSESGTWTTQTSEGEPATASAPAVPAGTTELLLATGSGSQAGTDKFYYTLKATPVGTELALFRSLNEEPRRFRK